MIQFDYTFFIALCCSMLIGITSGIVGCFMILQRQSLLGDALAHATLPGIAIVFLCLQSKDLSFLFLGGFTSACIGFYCINFIHKKTNLKKETALGIVLSASFGLGTVFLSVIQQRPHAHKSGMHTFLLGNIATLLKKDLICHSFVTLLVLLIIVTCWKEIKIFMFDIEFAQSIGLKNKYIELILTLITILTIIIGLQALGAVLISSLLIAPATAAAQWTKKLSSMVCLSALFSCIATIIGTCLSFSIPHIPTGPVIAIIATSLAFISIAAAPYLKKICS